MELKLMGETSAIYETYKKPLPLSKPISFGNFQVLTTTDGLNGRIFIEDKIVRFSPDFKSELTFKRETFQELFEKDCTAEEVLRSAREVILVIDAKSSLTSIAELEHSLRLLANNIGGVLNRIICFTKDNDFTKELFYITVAKPNPNM